jgi:nucleotide-binding universal stress UspA family protein
VQRYDPGDSADLRHYVRNADGVLTAATVTFEITKPDGATQDFAPTTESVGIYDVTVPKSALEQLGRYRYEWTVSGPVDDAQAGAFYVAELDTDELPPLVEIERLFAKIGYVPESFELTRAAELLDEASELARDVAGMTWASETTGVVTGVPRRVRSIVVEAAYRAFTNPEGLTQRSIGDSAKSFDRSGREGGEIVYLTTAEEKAIRKAAGTSSLTVATLVVGYNGSALDPWAEATVQ